MVFPVQGIRLAGPKGQAARVSDDSAVVERESVYQGLGTCGGLVSVNGAPYQLVLVGAILLSCTFLRTATAQGVCLCCFGLFELLFYLMIPW